MGNNNMSPLGPNKKKRVRFNLYWMYAIIALLLFGLYYANDPSMSKEVNWSEFEKIAKEGGMTNVTVHAKKDYVEAQLNDSTAKAIFKTDKITGKPIVYTNIPSGDSFATTLEAWKKDYGFNADVNYENSSDLTNILWTFGPIVFFIIFWIYLARRMTNQGGGGGGGVFNVGKAKAQLFDKDGAVKVTFDDVAGLSEAKQEVVAKAVAGEANVPFFSLSGSDFVEMFVGVGASRVRDLFRQAKEKAPCIVFIDEIDAVGRARGKNPNMGSNDERENTLNQLLTEMDGFGSNSGVIILAATNRADILDKALLRAGRFDRQIYVELPELNDRKAIFKVHLRNVKIDDSVDVDLLARQTPGFSGADIANVCNEAALIAARKNKKSVQRQDFMDAVDRIVGGLEKRSKITTQEEKRSIAIHEAGHASISWLLQYANPLIKVTIVPRGRALGAAWYLPEERQITTREQMLDEMCATLGGRAAEEVFLGRISTGASNDLERVTKQAYAMVVYFGMSEQLPNLSYYDSTGQEYGFTKPYSEDTAKLIDKEVSRIVNEQYERAKSILRENAEKHAKLAEVLITREVIFAEDVEQIFGKRPWISRTEEILQDEETAKKEEEAEHKKSEAEGNQTPDDEKPATGDSGNSNDQPKAENGETKENEKDTPDAKA